MKLEFSASIVREEISDFRDDAAEFFEFRERSLARQISRIEQSIFFTSYNIDFVSATER